MRCSREQPSSRNDTKNRDFRGHTDSVRELQDASLKFLKYRQTSDIQPVEGVRSLLQLKARACHLQCDAQLCARLDAKYEELHHGQLGKPQQAQRIKNACSVELAVQRPGEQHMRVAREIEPPVGNDCVVCATTKKYLDQAMWQGLCCDDAQPACRLRKSQS
jgi:hypothetical protein